MFTRQHGCDHIVQHITKEASKTCANCGSELRFESEVEEKDGLRRSRQNKYTRW